MRNILYVFHSGLGDFSIHTQEAWDDTISGAVRNSRLSGGVIALLSLMVGGIGIMNIMFATINERIRELGLRKALGATQLDILGQILIEGVVIALLGGIIGMIVSQGLVEIIKQVSPSQFTPFITPGALVLGLSISIGVGVMAAFVPGLKASGISSIEALRYE